MVGKRCLIANCASFLPSLVKEGLDRPALTALHLRPQDRCPECSIHVISLRIRQIMFSHPASYPVIA